METRECIKTRRSIRRFTDQPISDEVLIELLEAIRWAPSWANTQPWEVVVVKDQVLKEKLADCLSSNNPARKGMLEAPVVIAVCCKVGLSGYKKGEALTDKGDWYMFDGGIACQNLCLAAHDLGLGTVHVGAMDHKKVDELLGLPPDVKSLELIPVGYPAQEGKAPPRKELESFVHLNRYGTPFKVNK
ncbi:Nitroreductase [Thermosyntropha lipolytica DSM 11003]|uniref:Nitroreductase n=1 Tax=Thermosyntropha lipolytica DSM 11003 TaxID=1123382 RepID=A0A1M5RFA0_9FIRM|nr:nitroreductase family protein [Thermosyntropha lipolytica]SHH24800.1 Nitroreductase [Thermosyntropha lipolytica DSM 11003]